MRVEPPARAFNWRTDTFHPEARRQWADIWEARKHRGGHNICAEEEPEYRFLGLHWCTWLIMSAIAGAGWLAGLPL